MFCRRWYVLLVIADDDRDSAETLAQLLRLLLPPPVDIVLAFDGKGALAAVTNGAPRPDAVILDIEMPRMDGVNAALAIRNALGSETPTLIAVSGHVDVTRLARVNSAFDHALPKPVQVNELLRLLGSL
jgi:two-component system response regulator MprA